MLMIFIIRLSQISFLIFAVQPRERKYLRHTLAASEM